MSLTKWRCVCLVALLGAWLAWPALAQHRPSGQGQQHGQAAGKGQPTGQPQGPTSQERVRVRVTSEQRVSLEAVGQTANRARNEARLMERTANEAGLDVEQARQVRDRLRKEFQQLEREHKELTTELTAEQRVDYAEQLRDLERTRDRLREQVRQLCDECDKAAPDRQRIRDRAKALNKETERLSRQYRTLGTV